MTASFYAVFDGHGGVAAADYASKHVFVNIRISIVCSLIALLCLILIYRNYY